MLAGALQAQLEAAQQALAQHDELVAALKQETAQAGAMRTAAVEKALEATKCAQACMSMPCAGWRNDLF